MNQPEIDADKFSPKASVRWEFAPEWSAKASIGQAYRFPTVSELYQAITTGATLTVPNPNLRPEDALSTEWSIEHALEDGNVRLTYFTEDIEDALISQSAPLVAGSPTLFNFVQNIDKVESRGVELVATKDNVLIQGLSLTGSATWVDSKTRRRHRVPRSRRQADARRSRMARYAGRHISAGRQVGVHARRPLFRSRLRHDR